MVRVFEAWCPARRNGLVVRDARVGHARPVRIGSVGVAAQVPEALERAGHEVVRFPRAPSRAEALGLELLVVCGFPRRLGPDVFAAPRLGTWNVHPSLLPARRGPQPLRWAILRGDERLGVTVHQMSDVIDAGDIWWQQGVRCEGDGYTASLAKLVARAADVLPGLVAEALAGRRPVPQAGPGSYDPRVPPALRRIDPALEADTLVRRVAATDDIPAKLVGPDGHVALRRAARAQGPLTQVGRVVAADRGSVTFGALDGLVRAEIVVAGARQRALRAGDELRPMGLR